MKKNPKALYDDPGTIGPVYALEIHHPVRRAVTRSIGSIEIPPEEFTQITRTLERAARPRS